MADPAQLSRIAAIDPDPAVMIVKIDAVGGIFLWLCAKHEAKRAKSYPVLERRRPVSPVECDDCRAEKRRLR